MSRHRRDHTKDEILAASQKVEKRTFVSDDGDTDNSRVNECLHGEYFNNTLATAPSFSKTK